MKWTALALGIGLLTATAADKPPPAPDVVPAALQFEDQFDRKADLADLKGAVVVLVYGDRKGTDECKALGEKLHLAFHPTAKGMPPAKARQQPPAPLPGLAAGQTAPDVCVVPVACVGKVPGPVRGLIRTQVAKGSPDVPVWLDFRNAMKDGFGLTPGEANVVVFDALGRPRAAQNGTPDPVALIKLVQAAQDLRAEAVSGK